MKSLTLIILLFLVANIGTAQGDSTCGTIGGSQFNRIAGQLGGIYLTAQGTLKVLVVFMSYSDDNNNHPYWPAHQPPTGMSSFIDPDASTNSTHYVNLTNYFRKMSNGLFTVIGQTIFVETPHTKAYYDSAMFSRSDRVKDVLVTAVDPLVNFAEYDSWWHVADYDNRNQSDNTVDLIITVWRGLQYYLGEASLGGGTPFMLDGKTIKMAFYGEGSGLHCSYPYTHWPEKLLQTMEHETSHWLLGANHPYYDCLYSHWSMLGCQFVTGVCANAYEREVLGWMTVNTIIQNKNTPIGDFLNSSVAYRFHPPAGNPYEYFYIENHQLLNIYDDITLNPNDKGVSILHLNDMYYDVDNVRIKPSDGRYNWENPNRVNACGLPPGQTVPVFGKIESNRSSGYSHRDRIPSTTGGTNPDWLFVYKDRAGQVLPCNSYYRGYGFAGSFSLKNDVFSPYSNPNSQTWNGQESGFSIVVIATDPSTGVVTVRYNSDPLVGPPSKPQDPRLSSNSGQYGNIRFSWAANQEPDLASYEVSRKVDLYGNVWEVTVPSTTNTYWVDPEYLYAPGGGDFRPTYRVRAKDTQGLFSVYSDEVSVRAEQGKISVASSHKPSTYSLSQNFPNPFNPSTHIKFEIPDDQQVLLKVFNTLGEEVATLVNGFQSAGSYSVPFDASQLSSGVYIYTLKAGNYTASRKLLLVK